MNPWSPILCHWWQDAAAAFCIVSLLFYFVKFTSFFFNMQHTWPWSGGRGMMCPTPVHPICHHCPHCCDVHCPCHLHCPCWLSYLCMVCTASTVPPPPHLLYRVEYCTSLLFLVWETHKATWLMTLRLTSKHGSHSVPFLVHIFILPLSMFGHDELEAR